MSRTTKGTKFPICKLSSFRIYFPIRNLFINWSFSCGNIVQLNCLIVFWTQYEKFWNIKYSKIQRYRILLRSSLKNLQDVTDTSAFNFSKSFLHFREIGFQNFNLIYIHPAVWICKYNMLWDNEKTSKCAYSLDSGEYGSGKLLHELHVAWMSSCKSQETSKYVNLVENFGKYAKYATICNFQDKHDYK